MYTEQLLTSFLVGITATSTPCVLILYPGYIAYLATGRENLKGGKGSYLLGFTVLFGTLSAALLLGLIVTYASLAIGDVLVVVTPIADVVLIMLGTLLILNRNPFARIAQVKVPMFSNPYSSSFTYGLLYGPLILPCNGALAVSVFALSFSAFQFLQKLSLFLVFGLGTGLPLLAISLVAASRRDWLARQLALRHTLLNRIAGLILLGVGFWSLKNSFSLLSSYL